MTREELYEAGTAALVQHKHTDFTDAVTVVIDTVEPLIRADEVERRFGWVSQEDARAWFLSDLRAKVEALPVWNPTPQYAVGEGQMFIARADVLALLDGGGDE